MEEQRAEQDPGFPSGPWMGFYTYMMAPQAGFQQMELDLSFKANRIVGDGTDNVGKFVIKGSYDRESRKCSWTKTYLGSHSVAYEGHQSGKTIQGTWVIRGTHRGGFSIWPAGELGLSGEFFVSEEVQAPQSPVFILTPALR